MVPQALQSPLKLNFNTVERNVPFCQFNTLTRKLMPWFEIFGQNFVHCAMSPGRFDAITESFKLFNSKRESGLYVCGSVIRYVIISVLLEWDYRLPKSGFITISFHYWFGYPWVSEACLARFPVPVEIFFVASADNNRPPVDPESSG